MNSAPHSIRTPVRQPKPRTRMDPMLIVWAVLFLGVLAGLVRGSEAIRNGWNPLAERVEAAPLPVVEEKVMHICTDAKGQEFKQEALCPEIIKTVSGKTRK